MTSQQSNISYSEPDYAKSNPRAKSAFYTPNIDHRLVPETVELLEKYSHVPKDQQSAHIHKIRDQAWDIRAYPCIGLGAWLTPQLSHMPIYPEVFQRVRDGAVLMDVGTFLGHDLRRLAYDGAPSDQLYGVDIVNHFDTGYDFFRDRAHFRGHFIEADILATAAPALAALTGRVDVVVVSQVLHQWDWANQLKAAQALAAYTRPGSIVVGNQIGSLKGQEIFLEVIPKPVWRHDPESFAKMWEAVGAATGTKWETQALLRNFREMGWDEKDTSWMEPDARLIEFVARRIS